MTIFYFEFIFSHLFIYLRNICAFIMTSVFVVNVFEKLDVQFEHMFQKIKEILFFISHIWYNENQLLYFS